ncbi:MAG: hypothetical protein ACOCUH_00105 [Bacteriovoracia bacterium]
MKILILTITLSLISSIYANELNVNRHYDIDQLINNPSVSQRCKDILRSREKKINQKIRIKNLMKRTKNALKVATGKRQSAVDDLKLIFNRLSRKHYLTTLRIKTLEETIVRRGCPGILIQ